MDHSGELWRESRKTSLIETISSARSPARKDSVAPIACASDPGDRLRPTNTFSEPASPADSSDNERTRRFSRRLSLKPPSNVYRERRESPKGNANLTSPVGARYQPEKHIVHCKCGREIQVSCIGARSPKMPTITLSGVEVTDRKQDFTESTENMPPQNSSSLAIETKSKRKSSIKEVIINLQASPDDYENALDCCREMRNIEDQDSLEVVLSRQTAIQSLLRAMQKFPKGAELQLEACKSLLKQVQHSEASLHYLTENGGIKLLQTITRTFPENTGLLEVILDIYGFYSFQDEWRDILTEKVNPSHFLTTMARHENDVIIIEKCCVVVGNLVLSEDIARSMMYVGGVHSIISMMTKYSQNVDILKHCCNALGTFASHDDTCQAVSEAGATCAVMTVMTSFPSNPALQESCCWALASLSRAGTQYYSRYMSTVNNLQLARFWMEYSRRERMQFMTTSNRGYFRSDCVCMELMHIDAFNVLLNTMTSFPLVACIQEYGCWALCNLVVLASRLDDKDFHKAVEILMDCSTAFSHNVELIEHICYAINTIVSVKENVHETVVRLDGVSRLIELMRTYEENVDVQLNGCKTIGNLAVNVDFRKYAEDMGASEVIIAGMLKMDKNLSIQNTGCLTLTNLSADVADNKFRILKNGAVHAALQSMVNNREDETLQLNALKLLCNLIESDKGCWWIVEEKGIQIISMTLRSYSQSPDILTFGCTCLANLPRRGVTAVALESVESTLLYLRLSISTSVEVARALCSFYENAVKGGKECKKLFNKNAVEKILLVMQDFDDIDVQISGCKTIAQVAIDEDIELLTRAVTFVMLSTMKTYMSNSSIQMICCGTISFLSSSAKGLETLQEMCCIDVLLQSMKSHLQNAEIHSVCLLSLENICRQDLVRGSTTQHVCDAVALSMKAHPDNREIQLGGCHILSIIGKGFHKQNELRRQSVDFFEPLVNAVHRKSVTDEILEVASTAIHKLKKFAMSDDVLEDENVTSEASDEKQLGIELENMNLNARRNSQISVVPETTTDED